MSGVGHDHDDYSILSLFTWSASPDQESHCELIYLLKYTSQACKIVLFQKRGEQTKS